MSDLEAALAAHLNGKFFWEPTNNLDETEESRDALEIRRAQRVFAKGAKNITTRNRDLKEITPPKPKKICLAGEQKKIEPIVNAISYAYNVPPDQLISRSTSTSLAKPKRHLYWALFRYIPGMSFKEAGRLLGGKCHTTVMHGVATFKENQDHAKIVEVDLLMGRL